MSKKKASKKLLKKATAWLVAGVTLCTVAIMALTFYLIWLYNKPPKQDYVVEDRVDNIKNTKLKEVDGIETVGWIRVQGTNIDYPVIYTTTVPLGDIVDDFAWTRAKFDELNNITFVSGHNIKNLSKTPAMNDPDHNRFEQLMSFTYYDFIKKNQYIQYTVGGKNYLFKVYSVMFEYYELLDLYNDKSYTKAKMKKYIKTTVDNSIFDFRDDVNYNDKIISLVTCSRMKGEKQFVVSARLVRDDEKVELSNVHRTKNYLEIDEMLKGGSSNEEW